MLHEDSDADNMQDTDTMHPAWDRLMRKLIALMHALALLGMYCPKPDSPLCLAMMILLCSQARLPNTCVFRRTRLTVEQCSCNTCMLFVMNVSSGGCALQQTLHGSLVSLEC